MTLGIAGWPLRALSVDAIAEMISRINCELIEIPKDLLERVSLKELFGVLGASGKTISLAGTTDFAHTGGLGWEDYQRYLDVQVAAARFLRCDLWRVFLQASTVEELELSLSRVEAYSRRYPDLEVVVETHGGIELTQEGFDFCVATSEFRLVVDFANIVDPALSEAIIWGALGERIAYFHIRNLFDYREMESLIDLEARARRSYPSHPFLWEPKLIGGAEAVDRFRQFAA